MKGRSRLPKAPRTLRTIDATQIERTLAPRWWAEPLGLRYQIRDGFNA